MLNGDKAAVHTPPPPPPPAIVEEISHIPVPLPAWVLHTPEDCFVGISPLCASQAEARQQAVASAMAQVLQAMGADYDLRVEAKSRGSAKEVSHELRESLRYTARWLMQEIQQGIRQTIIQEHKNRYLAYVLLEVRPNELARMRRLTIGPRLSARVVRVGQDFIDVEVREANGVAVILTDYRLESHITNTHARAITLFAFKVPEASHVSSRSGLAQAMRIQGSAARQTISRPAEDRGVKEIILGSQTLSTLTLTGQDQLGRTVLVTAEWR